MREKPDVQPPSSHFVDGEFIEDDEGQCLDSIYPADEQIIAHLHSATSTVMEKAILSAQKAQKEWSGLAPSARGRILRRAAEIIRERNRELSEIETLDTGKPIQETLVSDAASGADALEFFGSAAATFNGEFIPLGNDFAYTVREPLGVCLGIGAWNYPTQIACWKAAPALASGNAMIFKPSELTPLGALKLAEVLVEAGVPPGVFNVVQGFRDVGRQLVSDQRIAKVSLTGSVGTGREVYSSAASQLHHATMELGGKSPLVIFEDANVQSAVSAAINANFYSSGQICSNGTRVYVHDTVHDKFVDTLVQRTAKAVIGDPMDEATQMGPLISAAHRQRVLQFVESGKAENADLVLGGAAPQHIDQGYYLNPTIFVNVTDDMRIAKEEIFGPVMSVLRFSDEQDVIERANASEYGLAAGVFTADISRAHRMASRLEAGTCWVNTYNLTPVEIPFGGIKQSGIGRENSRIALDQYSQVKTVYVCNGSVESAY